MVYAWLEPGGSSNYYFQSTKSVDVLLRSLSYENVLVFGNQSTDLSLAGLYISSNNVGIKVLPEEDTAYALSINGSTLCGSNLSIGSNGRSVEITSNSLAMSNNILITDDGLLQNNIIVSKDIKCSLENLTGVKVIRLTQLLTNTITGIPYPNNPPYYEVMFDTDVFDTSLNAMYLRINKVFYKVVEIIESTLAQVTPMYGSLSFAENDIVDIETLENFDLSDQSIHETIGLSGYIQSVILNGLHVVVTIQIVNLEQVQYIVPNHHYSIHYSGSHVLNHVCVLLSVEKVSSYVYTLTFKTIDNVTFPLVVFPPANNILTTIIVLDTIDIPSFRENDVIWGTVIFENSVSYLMKNSSGWRPEFKISRIIVDGPPLSGAFDVINCFPDPLNSSNCVLNLFDEEMTHYMMTKVVEVDYNLIGIPLKLTADITSTDNVFVYTVESLSVSLSLLEDFVGAMMYFPTRGGFAKLLAMFNLDATNGLMTLDIQLSNLFVGDYFYIFPFRKKVIKILSWNETCYIGGSLGIGTKAAFETLTVKGDMSVVESLYIKNLMNTSTFMQRYTSENEFTLNNVVNIKGNDVYIAGNLEVKDEIISKTVFSLSDKRTKKNIRVADNESDFNKLMDLVNVYDYTFKSSIRGKRKKGVIAQEIKKIMPEAVQTTSGFIDCMCKPFRVNKRGYIIMLDAHDLEEEMVPGNFLKIKDGQSTQIRKMLKVKKNKGAYYVKCENMKVEKKVYVFGPMTNKMLVVDNTHIMMTMLSGFKWLAKRI
jgi:hypothetical protein